MVPQGVNQGNALAQSSLGLMYREGKGVPQDYSEAIKLFRMAATSGGGHLEGAIAKYVLGDMYASGQGGPKDYSEAATWYRKAAEWGYVRAQVKLGKMYATGQGVAKDKVQAHKWLNLAASDATDGAKRTQAIADRDEVARQMTTAQIAEAQKLAREWKLKKN
jgi:uncharacterized protein